MTPFLYAGRHGQTDYNLRDCLLGHLDPPLNATGEAHAASLAAWFADKPIARIYSSPLQRALRTAQRISETTGAPILVDPLLIEVSYGDIDGMPISEAKANGIYAQRNLDRMNFRPPNGETYHELRGRLDRFFAKELILQSSEPVAVISHMGTARMMAALLGAMTAESAAMAPIGHETILTAWRGPDNEIETKIEDISQHDRIQF